MADDGLGELRQLERDIGQVAPNSSRNMRSAVQVTSQKIRDAWRGKVSGSDGFPGLATAVTYTTTETDHSVEAEIGIDKARHQGPLGNISEFGSPSHPARGYGLASLQENEGDFDHGLQRAIDDALGEAGL